MIFRWFVGSGRRESMGFGQSEQIVTSFSEMETQVQDEGKREGCSRFSASIRCVRWVMEVWELTLPGVGHE